MAPNRKELPTIELGSGGLAWKRQMESACWGVQDCDADGSAFLDCGEQQYEVKGVKHLKAFWWF